MINNIASSRMAIDPVCGMKVDPQTSRIFSTYKKNDFYFCADACRKAFAENPAKYLDDKPEKPKGIWQRYLARLNKATGGKPPACCG
ncbi:MAG: YHS domain-containing protein [Desulfobacterales bacterium]